jgi:hypothetical protein
MTPRTLDLIAADYKFVRVLPEMVPEAWDTIRPFIEDGLKDCEDGFSVPMIYSNLLAGLLEPWILINKEDGGEWADAQVAAVFTTQVIEDSNSGNRNLLVYTASGVSYLSDELWEDMAVATANLGRSHSCNNIVAVSSNPRVIEVFKMLGASTKTRYLVKEIGV